MKLPPAGRGSWLIWCSLSLQVLIANTASNYHYFAITPSNESRAEGETVVLKCKIGNQGKPFQTQWVANSVILGKGPLFPGYERYSMVGDPSAGEYHLEIVNVSLEDDGKYECQSLPTKEAEGERPLRSAAILTVLVPPDSVKLEPRPEADGTLAARADTTIDVSCTASNGKPAAKVVWYRNGRVVENEKIEYLERVQGRGLVSITALLHWQASPNDNNAVFTCSVMHEALKKSQDLRASFTLNVFYPPGVPSIEVDGFSADHSFTAGERVKLRCAVEGGNPPPRLEWKRNGQQIDETYKNLQDFTTNEYEFVLDASDDGAEYQCLAENKALIVPLASTIRLKVLYPPSQVSISGNSEAKIGESVQYTCLTAPSNPPAGIDWTVDGKPFGHHSVLHLPAATGKGKASMSNITFDVPREQRDITVHCSAYNAEIPGSLGRIATSRVIQVLYPPDSIEIFHADLNKPLVAGSQFQITCVARGGNPMASLQWFRGISRHRKAGRPQLREITDGVVNTVSGQYAKSELSFTVQPEDNRARYTCKATNAATVTPLVEHTNFSVLFPPEKVSVKVESQHLKAGQIASLLCQSFSSNPAATISWWRDGQELPGFEVSKKSGAHGGWEVMNRVNIPLSAQDDGSTYLCRARNEVSTPEGVSDQLSLNVKYRPMFVMGPQLVSVLENESFVVNVTALGNPQDITYKWQRDSVAYAGPYRRPSETFTDRFVYQGALLTVSSVDRSDAGIFSVEAVNSEGAANVSVRVQVKFPAEITRVQDEVLVNESESVKLRCEAEGVPTPEMHWERAGFDMTKVRQSARDGTAYLFLDRVNKADTGAFYCVATNGMGSQEARRQALLLVRSEPKFVHTPRYLKAAASPGEVAQLVCLMEGVPAVNIQWSHFRDNVTLSSSDRYRIVTERVGPSLYKGVLQIFDVQQADVGFYICEGYNELIRAGRGDAPKAAVQLLDSRRQPDFPGALEIVNVTQTSITLSWLPGFDGGYDQTFQVQYRRAGSNDWLDRSVDPPNATVITIDDLSPDTRYIFRVRAMNKLGTMGYPPSAQPATTLSVTSASGGVRRTNVKEGAAWELILGSLGAGLLLVILNVSLLVYFCRRRKQRKLQEKAATTRLPMQKPVPLYGGELVHHDSKKLGSFRPDSQYTADMSDILGDVSDEEGSVKTVIEVDSSGRPIYIERVNPSSHKTFLSDPRMLQNGGDVDSLHSGVYAEALRNNSLQRRIAQGTLYNNAGYQETPKLGFAQHPVQPAVSPSSGDGSGGVPSPLGPLRSISEELNHYTPSYAHYQPVQSAQRNGLSRKYSPANSNASIPTVIHVNGTGASSRSYAEVRPMVAQTNCTNQLTARQSSPVLSTFGPAGQNGVHKPSSHKTAEFLDYEQLPGDLV